RAGFSRRRSRTWRHGPIATAGSGRHGWTASAITCRNFNRRRNTMAVSSGANSGSFKTTTPSDREITLTRLFSAPRQLVFDAMTKPEHVRRWWGILDENYSLSRCDID